MKHTFSHRLFPLSLILTLLFLIVFSGCATHKETPPPAPVIIQENTELEEVTGRLEDCYKTNRILAEEDRKLAAQLLKQKQITAQLQLNLLEKYAEINKLTLKNERLVREFVRNKTKLQNRGNKVESVRLIAEVTAVINTVKENQPDTKKNEMLQRAEQYMAESKIEIDQGNYEGASYLASQALEQIQVIQLEIGSKTQEEENPLVNFLAPLDMSVLENSNLRESPSLKAKVRSVLKAGSPVTAIGYKGEWVLVEIGEQVKGWLYYSLLSGTWQ